LQSVDIIPTANEIEGKIADDYIIEELDAENVVQVSYDKAGNVVIQGGEDYQPEGSDGTDESDHFDLLTTNQTKKRQREERKEREVPKAKIVRFQPGRKYNRKEAKVTRATRPTVFQRQVLQRESGANFEHMNMQDPLKCRKCQENNQFHSGRNYEFHMREAHDGDPIYNCDICGYNTSTYWNFVAHLHEDHTDPALRGYIQSLVEKADVYGTIPVHWNGEMPTTTCSKWWASQIPDQCRIPRSANSTTSRAAWSWRPCTGFRSSGKLTKSTGPCSSCRR
jgi:hypothetical protein